MTTTQVEQQEPILIPIRSTTSASIPEWALLELNGDLLVPLEMPNDIDLLELGSLQFQINDDNTNDNQKNTNDKHPVFICGTHRLQGRVEALKQPFVVLQKQSNNEADECTIQGIITHKLLFNRYPKTILS